MAVVQTFEPLILRGAAQSLHTARAVDDRGQPLFNFPLLPDGERALMFDRPLGRVTLRCMVHGEDEHVTELIVVGNPFLAFTGADGSFRLEGIPAGELTLTGWSVNGIDARAGGPASAPRVATAPVTLAPGASVEGVQLTLP
jgi:hypothetical protein